jgi:uncharacterized lipoprotein YajG
MKRNAHCIFAASLFVLAGCAGTQQAQQQTAQDANAQARARIHTELSAGYYARASSTLRWRS